MRTKFGVKGGDDEEDEDEIEKKELEENERRAKHSIEGILGDRCKSTSAARLVAAAVSFPLGLLSPLTVTVTCE